MSDYRDASRVDRDLLVAQVTNLLTSATDRHSVLTSITELTRTGYVDALSVALLSTEEPGTVIVESAVAQFELSSLLAVPNPASLCARTGSVVMVDDTTGHGEHSLGWSAYLERAAAVGARGVRAFPMTLSSSPAGALVVHTETPWQSGANVLFGQTMADLAAMVLSSDRFPRAVDAGTVNELLTTTVSIDQAVGMLAVRYDLAVDDARRELRRMADAASVPLGEFARRLVADHGTRR